MSEPQQAAAKDPPAARLQAAKAHRDRLVNMVKGLHEEAEILAKALGIPYRDATMLMVNMHVNELHRIAMQQEMERFAAKAATQPAEAPQA